MNIFRFFMMMIALLTMANCSAPEPKKVDTTQTSSVPEECKAEEVDDSAAADAGEADAGEADTADGEADAATDSEGTTENEEAALFLQDEVTYEKDIKPLVESGCAISGCHVAGAQAPTLETYAQNAASANDSILEIQAGRMPVGTAYSDAQKALWQSWVDGGAVQGDPVASSDGDTDADGASDGDGTGDADGTDGDGAADDGGEEDAVECEVADTTTAGTPSELLNEEEVKACNDKGVLYDHNEKQCSTITSDTNYTCDRTGIENAFANSGLEAAAILDQSLGTGPSDDGEGFTINQCGQTAGGLPVVILVRVQEPPETPGLKVRVLTVD